MDYCRQRSNRQNLAALQPRPCNWLLANRKWSGVLLTRHCSLLFEVYGAKYPKAVACLTRDRSALLSFCDPRGALEASALHQPNREHIRNRAHRTIRSKGCLGRAGRDQNANRETQMKTPPRGVGVPRRGFCARTWKERLPQSGSFTRAAYPRNHASTIRICHIGPPGAQVGG
jgi:hypothetical protein